MNETMRLPRNRRIEKPPAMRLTKRDIEIIKTVYDFRVLRGDQIQSLFFGSQSTASYRLLRLYQHEYLNRHFLPTLGGLANSPTLYTLDKAGIAVLRRDHGLAPEDFSRNLAKKELSPLFLEHILDINSFRVSVNLAVKDNGYDIEKWIDDGTLKSDYDRVKIRTTKGRSKNVSLIPDGYFTLQVPRGKSNFFLEIDRGTMTNQRFQEKILAYQAYISSGQYQRRYKTKSLRVLTVTVGEKRLVNLKKKTEEVQGEKVFWFTTLDQVSSDTVLDTPIWHVAGSKGESVLILR